MTIQMTDGKARPVSKAKVTVEGDMTHPGMSPVFSEATEVAPGQYRGVLEFTMPGDWAVLVHGTLAGGRKIEKQFDIKSVE